MAAAFATPAAPVIESIRLADEPMTLADFTNAMRALMGSEHPDLPGFRVCVIGHAPPEPPDWLVLPVVTLTYWSD